MDLEDKLVCNVGVLPKGFSQMTVQTKCQVNKTNYKAVSAIYGEDCADWVGKEVQIKRVMANNPKTGEEVPSIKFVAVGGASTEEAADFIAK